MRYWVRYSILFSGTLIILIFATVCIVCMFGIQYITKSPCQILQNITMLPQYNVSGGGDHHYWLCNTELYDSMENLSFLYDRKPFPWAHLFFPIILMAFIATFPFGDYVRFKRNGDRIRLKWPPRICKPFFYSIAILGLCLAQHESNESVARVIIGQYWDETVEDKNIGDWYLGLFGGILFLVLMINGFPMPPGVMLCKRHWVGVILRVISVFGIIGGLSFIPEIYVITTDYYLIPLGSILFVLILILVFIGMMNMDLIVVKEPYEVDNIIHFYMLIILLSVIMGVVNIVLHWWYTMIASFFGVVIFIILAALWITFFKGRYLKYYPYTYKFGGVKTNY